MRFLDNNKVVGRLEIIKVDSRTGKEEVIFDDHNVITGGLGRSIAELMTRDGCVVDPCGQLYGYQSPLGYMPIFNPQEGVDYFFEEED